MRLMHFSFIGIFLLLSACATPRGSRGPEGLSVLWCTDASELRIRVAFGPLENGEQALRPWPGDVQYRLSFKDSASLGGGGTSHPPSREELLHQGWVWSQALQLEEPPRAIHYSLGRKALRSPEAVYSAMKGDYTLSAPQAGYPSECQPLEVKPLQP